MVIFLTCYCRWNRMMKRGFKGAQCGWFRHHCDPLAKLFSSSSYWSFCVAHFCSAMVYTVIWPVSIIPQEVMFGYLKHVFCDMWIFHRLNCFNNIQSVQVQVQDQVQVQCVGYNVQCVVCSVQCAACHMWRFSSSNRKSPI